MSPGFIFSIEQSWYYKSLQFQLATIVKRKIENQAHIVLSPIPLLSKTSKVNPVNDLSPNHLNLNVICVQFRDVVIANSNWQVHDKLDFLSERVQFSVEKA